MKRPSMDEYYLEIAKAVSSRSTCLKKHYGAVIVKNGEIISTGYNNPPRGEPHCAVCTKNCVKDGGEIEYGSCPSVHAEQNAIISAARKDMLGATLYLVGVDASTNKVVLNTYPCEICLRLIKNSGIAEVFTPEGLILTRDKAGILLSIN